MSYDPMYRPGVPLASYPPPLGPMVDPFPPSVEEWPRRRGPSMGGVIAVSVVTALLAGAVGGWLGAQAWQSTRPGIPLGAPAPAESSPAQDQAAAALPGVPSAGVDYAAIVEQVTPSVVSISVVGGNEEGSGSGFVIRPNGYILTNSHVVVAADPDGEVTVSTSDGQKLPARIVGRNASYDLAVLKVEATGLPVVTIGDSTALRVGDAAIAFGSPLGLTGTVTTGIISALNRPVTAGDGGDETSFVSALQTDAAINPGNSGGPLVDASGAVVGVNSAIATLGATVGSIGLGFAIPIHVAERIAEEIIATGRAATPVIGVSVDQTFDGPGARIEEVFPDSPAATAGLRSGEIIASLNGRAVNGAVELIVAIRENAPGDTVTLVVEREGVGRTVQLELAAKEE
ncbi:MAG: trypsin-like peptidase domain-containing protein [Actinomycetales bacterium]|nr:trypsin-like peptidase domain-containing protein [Actinomycetales bacterium]